MSRPRRRARFGPRDAVAVALWSVAGLVVLSLVERRTSSSLPGLLVVLLAVALGGLGWWVARPLAGGAHAPGSIGAGGSGVDGGPGAAGEPASGGFAVVAFVAAVAAFAVGVVVLHGGELRVVGGSADLAHHTAVVRALAEHGPGRYQEALPSLRFYPVGAHLAPALFSRLTGLDALSTTYLFGLLAVVGLFAAIAFTALQLRPRVPWATVAVLLWVAAAWAPIFLGSVRFNFFYSQEVGLALLVATVGFALSPRRRSPVPAAAVVACATAVGASYPTYVVLVLPVLALWLWSRRAGGGPRLLLVAAAVLGLPTLAAALSVFVGAGTDIAGHEGTIAPITASGYFGGPLLLFGALLGAGTAFASRGEGAGLRGVARWRAYLLDGPWALVRLWFVLAVGFFVGNWVLFRLDLYGSRYNTIKCVYPVAAGLAVLLGSFVGDVVPDRLLGGLSRRLQPVVACGAVLVTALWAGLLRPSPATISRGAIEAADFAAGSGQAFAPLGLDAIGYAVTVGLAPLDPGDPRASGILGGDPNPWRDDDLFVSVRPIAEPAAPDGGRLDLVCAFGDAAVYARPGSPAMSLAGRCPS